MKNEANGKIALRLFYLTHAELAVSIVAKSLPALQLNLVSFINDDD